MLCVLLWGLWRVTSVPVLVTVDGIEQLVYTHRRTVEPLLLDLGLAVHSNDRIMPAPNTPISDHLAINVERARPVHIWADGREWVTASWGETPAAVLTDAAIDFDSYDQVVVQGATLGMAAKLWGPGGCEGWCGTPRPPLPPLPDLPPLWSPLSSNTVSDWQIATCLR